VGGKAVVKLPAAYLETKPGDAAQGLETIAKTDAIKTVTQAAKEAGQ